MSIISGPSSYMHGRPRIVVQDQPPRFAAGALPRTHPPRRASVHRAPQEVIDDFWAEFQSKRPGKATSIIPQKAYADKAARRVTDKAASGSQSTAASYAEAAAKCRAKVAHIVKECRRVNQKYRDPHFDLELDLQFNRRDCLESLSNASPIPYGRPISISRGRRNPSPPLPPPPLYVTPNFSPQAVKRVDDIFDRPEFFIDGPTANDVRQGRDGDCWLMAALCTLSNKPGLIERVCVAHDASVGVYGFVFHRDGEWFSEIIDDKLYLTKPDYNESRSERNMLEDRVRINSEEAYRKIYQSNSGALYFAQCENPNETWLPLLEKAYAKAHGDYAAIEGGFTGEGIEDLTGGVTSELYTTDILDKEYFWNEELIKVNVTFLFGCSTGVWGKGRGDRGGIVEQHAYSVMRAIEMDGVRLVLLKNPWGRHEWKGAWSDGSKEWTAAWMQKLNHQFGDDGSFWISYEDLLRKYQAFDRTRLFGDDWATASIWTTMAVPWTSEYNSTKFEFVLARPGPVVLVLSQLDERYFRGLEGQYSFDLSFRLHKVGTGGETSDSEDYDAFDYVVRSQASYRMSRSVSVELDLDAGRYLVLVRIDAKRDDDLLPAEDVIRDNVRTRREKLIRIGLAYDLAHSKGRVVETLAEKKIRQAAVAKRKAKQKLRLKKHVMAERALDYLAAKIQLKNQRKEMAKARAKRKARDAKRQARMDEEERKAEVRAREETVVREKARQERDEKEREDKGKEGEGEMEVQVGKGGGAGNQLGGEPDEKQATTIMKASGVGTSTGTSTSTDAAKKGTPTISVSDKATVGAEVVDITEENGVSKQGVNENDPRTADNKYDEEEEQPQGAQQDRQRLSANHGRLSLGDGYDGDDRDRHGCDIYPDGPSGRYSRASSYGSRGDGAGGSREPSIESRDCGRVRGRGNNQNRRDGTSLPSSPIHAPIPRGRSVSRIPSPPPPALGMHGFYDSPPPPPRRHHHPRGPPSPPPPLRLPLHLGRGVGGGDPRDRRIHIRDLPRGLPGRSGDEESELSSLSSPSDMSDDELELIYKEQKHSGGTHKGGRHGAVSSPGGRQIIRPLSPRPGLLGRRQSPESLRGDYGAGDPWNAIAVVGLRIYYQEVAGDKERVEDIVQLRVERPHLLAVGGNNNDSSTSEDSDDNFDQASDVNSEDEDDDRGKDGEGNSDKGDATLGEEKVLDVDDSLKDATAPATGKEPRTALGDTY